jgi:hypothetical protein
MASEWDGLCVAVSGGAPPWVSISGPVLTAEAVAATIRQVMVQVDGRAWVRAACLVHPDEVAAIERGEACPRCGCPHVDGDARCAVRYGSDPGCGQRRRNAVHQDVRHPYHHRFVDPA